MFVQADVSVESDVKAMIQATVDTYGKTDVFVNVAGIPGYEPVTKITLDEWNRILNTNLTGAMLCCREVCLHMAANRPGVIVAVSSTIQFSAAYKDTLGPALKDPVVGPQLLQNIHMGRVAIPEDIGHAVVFLASNKCPYITGANLVIDGGFSLRPLVLASQDEIKNMNLL